ncbi:four helix bundle protein [Flavobacterium franklandianum]|uniref:Four helix bundle protein n=1 Tax=Flavobacterium franklandianum TaxID=2594430 RepID=A0A553CJ11_9FLAO|nr:four helix bundle protein [Flavobacterium franklandianum]TRX20487.1 four helix bundle protein [Flavobacterium franklandianum]TRX24800.1 four helix bundle protein [Flavobacterium franklandianum]
MRFQDLLAYKKSFELAMDIFSISINFPAEEKYSLTDQIRRSSRSVSANIAEATRKRKYEKHFVSKLTDSDAENAETQVWLEYSHACNYIDTIKFENLTSKSLEVGKLLNYMMNNPDKFL